ncbi:MAG: diguanylate cyclase [Bryobacteraceae bacterium]|nr:diguanylate cyclase [Bryobacteraceae bacterium]
MTLKARLYLAAIIVSGSMTLIWQLANWESSNLNKFGVYLVMTMVASVLKIHLPGITGTMSVYFLFVLIGITQLSLPEVMVVCSAATLLQCFWHATRRPRPIQLAFNLASNALAVASAACAYYWNDLTHWGFGLPVRLAAMALVFFVLNTGLVAVVIALTEGKPARRLWHECYFWCFPYYLLGASMAGAFKAISDLAGWETSVLILPIFYVVYGSYRLYLGRLQDEKYHAEQVAALHLRTIEALALAIDAKDHTTHQHLQRVQVYTMEVAKELHLPSEELRALEAATLLHDIGKLAVPEHIISKPGKLTPEEFEKMKIHPVIGAEILERVKFPYPVVPIVLAHHEKWDGTGYPFGLRGEEIPLGARILSAVDCLDALSSDRPYRRALPLEEAVKFIQSEAGKSYDPGVVDILVRRYRDFERLAQSGRKGGELAMLSRDVKVDRGQAPATGLDTSAAGQTGSSAPPAEFLMSIAAARQEAQALFELAQTLGSSLSLNDTLSVMATRLNKLTPFDAMVVYLVRDGFLQAEYATGEEVRLLCSLRVPVGQGLSGWVVENRQPIVNGSPVLEFAFAENTPSCCKLSSALLVPLESADCVVGVLALYSLERDAFSRDQLRVLQAVSSKLSASVENACKYEQAESSATTDYLTNLPNARSLFVHLDGEVARCARTNTPLAIVVCDLDGFKQVNDRFGHLAGNEVLKLVAAGLRECCREYDYVARMGGDEFVIVLPGLPASSASARIEEFDRVAVEVGMRVCGEEILSLSAGLAFHPEDGRRAEDLLAEADRRMYKEKQERKRVRSLFNLAGRQTGVSTVMVQ